MVELAQRTPASLLRRLSGGAFTALLLAAASNAQTPTSLPTLREACTIQLANVRADFSTVGPVTLSEPVLGAARLATTTELRRDLLSDEGDHDGVPGLIDSAPTIAGLGSLDGSYADIQAPGSGDTFSAMFRSQGWTSATQMLDTVLRASETEGTPGSPLYPPNELIDIAAASGLPPAAIDSLRRNYACGKPVQRRCRVACRDQFRHSCDSRCGKKCGRRDEEARELAACLKRCHALPKCPKVRGDRRDHDDDDDDDEHEEREERDHKGPKGGR